MNSRMSARFGVALVVVSVVAAGCGGSPAPTSASSNAGVAGKWAGVTSDTLTGSGNVEATISQSGTALTGTWAGLSNLSNGDSGGGTLSGTADASKVSLTLTPTVATNCPFSVTATVNGNQMSGTFTTVDCTQTVAGSFSLTKQ